MGILSVVACLLALELELRAGADEWMDVERTVVACSFVRLGEVWLLSLHGVQREWTGLDWKEDEDFYNGSGGGGLSNAKSRFLIFQASLLACDERMWKNGRNSPFVGEVWLLSSHNRGWSFRVGCVLGGGLFVLWLCCVRLLDAMEVLRAKGD